MHNLTKYVRFGPFPMEFPKKGGNGSPEQGSPDGLNPRPRQKNKLALEIRIAEMALEL